jgi:hypothetical protein
MIIELDLDQQPSHRGESSGTESDENKRLSTSPKKKNKKDKAISRFECYSKRI